MPTPLVIYADTTPELHACPQGTINAPCLLLDGLALSLCTEHHTALFLEVACAAPTVVVCRCTPTQKAEVVRLLRRHANVATAAIGDGGNDVGMIHAALFIDHTWRTAHTVHLPSVRC